MRTKPTRLASLAALAVVCGAGAVIRPDLAPEPTDDAPVYRLASLQQSTASASLPTRPDPDPSPRPSAGTLAQARAFSAAFADAAAAATPAVVHVRTERSLEELHGSGGRFEELFDQLPEGHPTPDLPFVADGSGFLVSADGLIITNNHVIAGADRITVILWDKRVFEATVVGTDPTTDLALITVDEGGLPHVALGDSDRLRVGEWVLAIGNPGFRDDNTLDFTVTSGIVSAKGRPLNVIQTELYTDGHPGARYAIEDFIQTDAAINPGNSGGPLLDLSGAVVGINTAIASMNGVNQGYGFAVPINVARRVMRDLLEHGRVRRPLLGISIQNVSPEDAQVYGLPRIAGVLVEDFADDSPAQDAGLRRHDVIVGIDGRDVERLGQFQRLVAAHDPGETVEVELVRYGERIRLPVTLTEADLGVAEVVRTTPERKPTPELGIELADLTRSMAREWRFRQTGGALVTAVVPGSAADRRDVPRGALLREVNRQPITSADQAKRIMASLEPGTIASLLLEFRSGETLIRNVRIP
jgi:serine protease Do